MKRCLALLMGMLLCLAGCAEEDDTAQRILQQYDAMESCRMEAKVRCEYSSESREYTLACTYRAGGECEVKILAPEGLQEISVVFDGEQRRVIYKDLVLDAPALGKNRLSAAEILPRLMDAVKQGWLLEENAEEKSLRRMVFETEENGVKQYWTVWFDEETGVPRCAEVSEDSQLFFTIEFTNFSFDDIITPTIHEMEKSH